MNRDLSDLDESLNTASQLLQVVSIIPEIGAEASETKKMIDEFHVPVKKALNVSTKIENVVGPIRNGIDTTDKQVKKIDVALLKIIEAEDTSITKITQFQNCLVGLKNQVVFESLYKKMDSLSSAVVPNIVKANDGQSFVIEGINNIDSKITSIISSIEKFANISDAIQSALNTLSPLIDALQAIKSVFSHKIMVPYPSICMGKGLFGVDLPYP